MLTRHESRTWTILATAAVLVATAAFVGAGAWPSTPGPRLQIAGAGPNDPVGGSVGGVPVHTPYLFETFPLCVNKGAVTPTGVELINPTGRMRLVDWGVSQRSSGIGEKPGATVASIGFFTHGPVTALCSIQGATFYLDVSVETGGTAPASTRGFRVVYGHRRSVVVPFRLVLCRAPQSRCPDPTL